jgi:acetyl-CoA carboxylase biotin carboxylase subunit
VPAHRTLPLAPGDDAHEAAANARPPTAEDPAHGIKPTPGRLTAFELARTPQDGHDGVVLRVDTHLAAGDEVVPYYDSLIAKVIAHAPTRAGAIAALRSALADARVEGVATTIPLHLAVLGSPEFASGDYSTRAIPGWPPR